jgi:hypothetical protein
LAVCGRPAGSLRTVRDQLSHPLWTLLPSSVDVARLAHRPCAWRLAVPLDALSGVVISDAALASLAWLASVSRAGHCAPCRVAESFASAPLSTRQAPRPAYAHLARPNGFPVAMPSATIRCERPRPRRHPEFGDSRRTPALRGNSCRFQDRRDRLRSRAARMSPRCHPAGSQRSARHSGHSPTDQHQPRWATAPPNPTAASRNPKRGARE